MQDPAFTAPASFPDGTALDAKGIFIKEIEDALAAGRVDLAVHSLKDLPTQLDPRFTLAAIPPRADARDAFVCEEYWGLHMLPSGARVATTSPRRQAMIHALRPDITFVEMRGNIDTRLRKWSEGQCDALVLASAGLDRLGHTEHVHQRFSVDELTPAPGQGALGLETRCPSFSFVIPEGNLRLDRTRDAFIHAAIATLNCPDTAYAVTAERAVLNALGGGCQLPLGAYCHLVHETWHLHATAVSRDGEQIAQVLHRAPVGITAIDLGQYVAEVLKGKGALELLAVPPSEPITP
jgi:hydroxymethylbilane synthase